MKGGKAHHGGRYRDLEMAIVAADKLREELSLPPIPRSSTSTQGDIDATHHLFRVRLRKSVFLNLQEIAKAETDRTHDYTSVSDIARVAISDWVNSYMANVRLGAMSPPDSEED